MKIKQTLDHNINRIYDLTNIIKGLERKLTQEPENPVVKSTLIQVLKAYERIRKETLVLLDEYFAKETESGVHDFNYRLLKRKLTS
jgi:hypothetical protein